MSYEYSSGDNLEHPLRYQYTEYRGAAFMQDWYMSRKQLLDQIDVAAGPEQFTDIQGYSLTDVGREGRLAAEKLLQTLLWALLQNGTLNDEYRRILDGFVKTFEVRKRLYPYYTAGFKPEEEAAYRNMTLYTGFACVCAAAFEQYFDLRYLNALLKVNDTLLSQWERREEWKEPANQKRLAYSLQKELDFVFRICSARGVVWEEA